VVRIGSANSVGKPTLYERGCHRPIFPHHWLKQSAAEEPAGRCRTRRSAIVMRPFAAIPRDRAVRN
jgi:hypothetical protein